LHIKQENSRAVKLIDVVSECRDVSSLLFRDEETRAAEPGQYLMVWLPGVDEVPMSVSALDVDGMSRITVREVGEATVKLSELSPGDRIGLRGPFGKGYRLQGDTPLLVAGGSGAASLMPLVEKMLRRETTPTLVLGARSADMLLFTWVQRLRIGLRGQAHRGGRLRHGLHLRPRAHDGKGLPVSQ